MKKKKNDKITKAKIRAMEENFYISVYEYVIEEYSTKISRLFVDSPIAEDIVDLVNQYYWGGNSVPNTAGDMADLLRSKYK